MFTATKREELPSFEEMLGVSGLEFMQKILDGEFSGPPIGGLMGFWLHAVEKGSVTFHGKPEFNVFNPMGTVHGGWYGTVLDSAMACSIMTQVPQGSYYTTQEYKINIVRGLQEGAEVEIKGKVLHIGRSTAVSTAEIRGVEDQKLYATGSTTCLIMRP